MSLDDVEEIGKELDCGSYGLVYKVRMNGLIVLEKFYMNVLLCILVNDAMITTSLQDETSDKFAKEYHSHSKEYYPNFVQLMGIQLQSVQADVPLLERIKCTLKSKDEVITTLESGLPAPLHITISYKDQKEKIRAHMKQQLRKGDKW